MFPVTMASAYPWADKPLVKVRCWSCTRWLYPWVRNTCCCSCCSASLSSLPSEPCSCIFLGCRCRVCFSLARPDLESSCLTPPSVSDPSPPSPTCLSRNKWWSSAAAWFWLSSWVHLSTASSNRDPNEESLPPSEATGGRRTLSLL